MLSSFLKEELMVPIIFLTLLAYHKLISGDGRGAVILIIMAIMAELFFDPCSKK